MGRCFKGTIQIKNSVFSLTCSACCRVSFCEFFSFGVLATFLSMNCDPEQEIIYGCGSEQFLKGTVSFLSQERKKKFMDQMVATKRKLLTTRSVDYFNQVMISLRGAPVLTAQHCVA